MVRCDGCGMVGCDGCGMVWRGVAWRGVVGWDVVWLVWCDMMYLSVWCGVEMCGVCRGRA